MKVTFNSSQVALRYLTLATSGLGASHNEIPDFPEEQKEGIQDVQEVFVSTNLA